MKGIVLQREADLKSVREAARAAKMNYDRAVVARSTAQHNVNSLLERKHTWTEEDVSRFTTLVRSDHASASAVAASSTQLSEAEMAVDKAFSELTQSILERYHEEQVWSDKIRSVSNWAGLVGLVVNLIVFVGAIAFVEPWKRKRLVARVEEGIAGLMDRIEDRLSALSTKVDSSVIQQGVWMSRSTTSEFWETSDTPPSAGLARLALGASWFPGVGWVRKGLSVAAPVLAHNDAIAGGIVGTVFGLMMAYSLHLIVNWIWG